MVACDYFAHKCYKPHRHYKYASCHAKQQIYQLFNKQMPYTVCLILPCDHCVFSKEIHIVLTDLGLILVAIQVHCLTHLIEYCNKLSLLKRIVVRQMHKH